MRAPFTIGTHNLLDGAAPATTFADVLFLTEATSAAEDQLRGGYDVYTCRQQRDLVIALAKRLGAGGDLEEHYAKALFGVRKVSPHRGTYWLTDDVDMNAFIDEHRINAGFPPYRRGEALFRKLAWWSHTRTTLRIIRRLKRQGYTVYAGGDINAPAKVRGYRGQLHEVGTHYDRLGSTKPIKRAITLSRLGSDHLRLRGVL